MFNTKVQNVILLFVFIFLLAASIFFYFRKEIDDKILFGAIGSIISFFYGLMKFQIEHDKVFNKLFTDFNNAYTKEQNDLINELRFSKRTELLKDEKNLIFDYFNLCAEEYLWFKRGRIPKKVWKAWRYGILENLKIPILREMFVNEISTIEGRSSYYGLPKNLKY